jgi:hypothetical protein
MAVDRDLITVLGCGFFLLVLVQTAIVKRTMKCWAGYVNVATFTPAISHYRVQLNSLTLLWTCFRRA